MKLEGSLDTFPLRELLDMINYSSVTGALHLYDQSAIGYLYFREGQLYHAERGLARGLEALTELLELQHAAFSFVSDIVAEQETLRGSAATHLTTAERLAARWRQVRAYVPNADLVFHLLVPRETALRRAGHAHAPVVSAIDGQASVRQIAAGLGWATIDLAETLAQLSLDGLVASHAGRAAAFEQPYQPGNGREGLFDRLRSRGSVPQGEAQQPDYAGKTPAEELTLRLLRGSG